MTTTLYYLIEKQNWTTDGDHKGSPLDLSDGFIHLSTREHLSRVFHKFFGEKKDVLLVTLDETKLKGNIEWITSQNTGGRYAHLFGTIPQEAILDIFPIEKGHPLTN